MARLNGKVAVITGGARGIGASIARGFVKEGAKVVITDILENEGVELAKELGENSTFIKHDVSNNSDWEKVVSETENTFGPINILVNNAGINHRESLIDHSEENFRRVIDINVMSVFYGMRAVVPSMLKTERGSIVNISSVSGIRGQSHNVAYSGSKFAVTGMSKAAAMEFAEHGIRVNSVHPGFIKTPMTEVDELQDVLDEMLKGIPVKRAAEPEEVTNLVLYLASDESSYSTGSEFIVDGGITAP